MQRHPRGRGNLRQGAEHPTAGDVLAGQPGGEQLGGQLLTHGLCHPRVGGDAAGLGRLERLPQSTDDLGRIQTPCQPALPAGGATTHRQQPLGRGTIGTIGLLVQTVVRDAQLPKALDGHTGDRDLAHGLAGQGDEVGKDLVIGHAQRVRIDVTEAIAHCEIRSLRAQVVRMRQDQPGVDGTSVIGQFHRGVRERVGRRDPRRRDRSQGLPPPRRFADGAVQRTGRCLDQAMQRVQRRCRPRAVIARRQGDLPDTQRQHSGRKGRVADHIPRVGVTDDPGDLPRRLISQGSGPSASAPVLPGSRRGGQCPPAALTRCQRRALPQHNLP